ncbi:ribosome hibernation-promoting factor, HPF/YfiA family [uncultured Veillonella sp.]|uniref:ribosome hibernation-promoting factor, HPF/YfiA family n=1 Tax=uncultured Veillonella sp. TaxID=159268 RepID=UPI00260DF048|nr:ribosome-associated translation inhibitor RaiA [uncultured Veillonella sp.]
MKVAIRGKNIEVTDALRAYIEKRLSKLTRYFDDELDAQAVLSVIKDKSTIELTCFVDKIVLRGVENNDDMYAAIDLVVDKIVRQIHKHKTRLAKRFKKQEAFHPEVLATPVEEETIEVVKRKRFAVRPMDVEEAILQMNLIGHDFFMFFNAETEAMNVVYRRHDGFYGLIEPELQ